MTSRHAVPAPLGLITVLRRHLREPGPVVLVGLLVAVVAGLLSAGSRAEQRAADQALGAFVEAAEPGLRDISLHLTPRGATFVGEADGSSDGEALAPFAEVGSRARGLLGDRLTSLVGEPQVSAQSGYFPVSRLTGETFADSPLLALRVQPGLDSHVIWISGRAPGASSATVRLTDGVGARTVPVVPIAVSEDCARLLGLRVGDRLLLTPDSTVGSDGLRQRPVPVEVVGVFAATEAQGEFWVDAPGMLTVSAIPGAEGGAIPIAVAVVGEDGYGALSRALAPRPRDSTLPGTSSAAFALEHVWRYSLDAERLRAADTAEITAALVRLSSPTAVSTPAIGRITLASGLSTVIERYAAALSTTRVVHSFAMTGVLGLGVLALALTCAVLLQRRTASLQLLAVRGASPGQSAGLLAAETALAAVPSAVVGWIAGGLVIDGPASSTALWSVVALAATPALVAGALAAVRGGRGRGGVGRSTARTAVEVLILAVTAFAVATALSRGDQVARGTADWSVAALPGLLALSATLVAVRLAEPVLTLAGRAAAARTGFRAMLGLTRAASGLRGSVLALAVVAVSVTLASFLGSVVSTLSAEASSTAYRAVGADVRIDAQRVDPPEVAALRARPGVAAAVEGFADPHQTVLIGKPTDPTRVVVQLIATSVADYRRMLEGTDIAFAAEPSTALRDGAVQVVVSGGLPLGQQGVLRIDGADIPFVVVGVDEALARPTAQNTAPVMLASLAALQEVAKVVQANTVLLQTSPQTDQALTGSSPTLLTEAVHSRRQLEAAAWGHPLTGLIRAGALMGALVAGSLTLLGVLLLLALTRPARLELLVRLRTMGADPGRDRVLGLIETLPGVLLSVVVGLVAAAVAPSVLAHALDLGALVGAPPLSVTVHPWLSSVVALTALDLALLALLIDARQAARTDLGQALRRGDRA